MAGSFCSNSKSIPIQGSPRVPSTRLAASPGAAGARGRGSYVTALFYPGFPVRLPLPSTALANIASKLFLDEVLTSSNVIKSPQKSGPFPLGLGIARRRAAPAVAPECRVREYSRPHNECRVTTRTCSGHMSQSSSAGHNLRGAASRPSHKFSVYIHTRYRDRHRGEHQSS